MRVTMVLSRAKRVLGVTLGAFALAAGTWACSLNPQPIPPGLTSDTAGDAGRSGDVSVGPGPFDGADGAGGVRDGAAPRPDGGDGSIDAGDAGSDARADADGAPE